MTPQKPALRYPVNPFHVNQPFGANIPCVQDFGLPTQSVVDGADNNTCPPGYTKLYAAFDMAGHNGIDLQAGEQPFFFALDGVVIEKQLDAQRGLGLGVISNEPLDLGEHGVHHLKTRYWHLKSFNVEIGQSVKAGDLGGITDTTGYSAGDHLHFEGDPMDKDAAGNYQLTFPNNGYAGAIDIAPYFNGLYASDIPLQAIKAQVTQVAQAVASINPSAPTAVLQEGAVERIIDFIKQELSSFL